MSIPDYSSGPPPMPPSGADPAARPGGRGPKVLMWLGGIMFGVGLIAFIAGFVVIGAKLFDTFDEAMDPVSNLDLTVDVPGEGSVFLEPDTYQVVALGPALTGVTGMQSDAGGQTVHRLPFAEPPYTVLGPDGEEVALRSPRFERLNHVPGLDTVGLREFTVPKAGEYTLDVGGESGDVTALGIGEAKGLWEEASGWVAGAAVTTLGGILMTIGPFVFAGGLVWHLVRRSSGLRVTSTGSAAPPGPVPPPPPA